MFLRRNGSYSTYQGEINPNVSIFASITPLTSDGYALGHHCLPSLEASSYAHLAHLVGSSKGNFGWVSPRGRATVACSVASSLGVLPWWWLVHMGVSILLWVGLFGQGHASSVSLLLCGALLTLGFEPARAKSELVALRCNDAKQR